MAHGPRTSIGVEQRDSDEKRSEDTCHNRTLKKTYSTRRAGKMEVTMDDFLGAYKEVLRPYSDARSVH